MSKGPGKVQREIAALIEANPDGAWPYEQLGSLIYGWDGGRLLSQKTAVGRALKTMRLPGTWTVMQAVFVNDRRFWLFDPCRLESWRKIDLSQKWRGDPAHFQPGGKYYEWWEEAVRRRDAGLPAGGRDAPAAPLDRSRAEGPPSPAKGGIRRR